MKPRILPAHKLTFVVAQPGEDLSAYKSILMSVYLDLLNDQSQRPEIEKVLEQRFAVVTKWIGQKDKLLIKAQDGNKPVGFLTLSSLNEDASKVAFHLSPLVPAHQTKIAQYFECLKAQFPNAKQVFAAASDKSTQLLALLKHAGFVEDSSYKPNPELVPDPKGFAGFRKELS